MIRLALCALAFLCAAVELPAQNCSWEADTPRPGRAAREDSIVKSVHAAHRSILVRAASETGVTELRGLLLVTVAPDGREPMVRLLSANFPAAALNGSTDTLVANTLRLPPRAPGRLATVVRLDTLPLPAPRADGRRRECPPRLRNEAEIRRELVRWTENGPGRTERGELTMVGMLVDRDGRVRHVEVIRPSTSSLLNEFALQVAARATFDAASLDGSPRDVWVALPIGIR
jgi:TonB family protein